MRHSLFIGLIVILSGVFAGCSDNEPETVPEATRTILVYMMADNSLDDYADDNIESMIEGVGYGKNNGGNLLIYYAGKGDEDNSLFEIKNSRKNLVKEYGEQDPTDPAVMQKIIRDAVSLYPADSYGLLLWSHGTAWLPADFNIMLRSFGQDGKNWMEIDELAKGLPDHLFDFILFDACYMASVECVYELRDKADYILASPTEVMGIGWPYTGIMPLLFAVGPEHLEKACEVFYQYYTDYSYPYGTVSLTRTDELENLRMAVRDILTNIDEADLVNLDLSNVQRLEYLTSNKAGMLYDLEDFLNQLATEEQKLTLARCLTAAVPYKASTPESYYANKGAMPVERFCGLNVFVPQPASLQLWEWYKKRLDWYNAVYR